MGGCPYCGETGKDCEATASLALGLRISTSVEHTRIEFGNRKARVLVVMVLFDLAFAAACWLVGFLAGNGVAGLVASLALIIPVNVLLKRKERVLVRQIWRG